jgi:hypothetical protein
MITTKGALSNRSISTSILVLSFTSLVVTGMVTASIITTTSTIAVAQSPTQNSKQTLKPIDGYNTPQGHLTAIRHLFDDPSLRVHHYCKPNDKIVLVCQLYDTDKPNSTLIGVEYVITKDQYNSLPDREKPNWHLHKIEFVPNRADPMFPELSAAQIQASMKKLMDTYGKVIITWNPKDKLPAFPPQVEEVQHPFMVNASITPNIHGGVPSSGTFNQTLKY